MSRDSSHSAGAAFQQRAHLAIQEAIHHRFGMGALLRRHLMAPQAEHSIKPVVPCCNVGLGQSRHINYVSWTSTQATAGLPFCTHLASSWYGSKERRQITQVVL